jgi:hypothetical protein
MTDQDRFENIESVRDLYREQGAERERERIIKLLENQDSVHAGWMIKLIKRGIGEE